MYGLLLGADVEVLHLERRGDGDAIADCPVHRAGVGVDTVRAFRYRALFRAQSQPEGDMDTANNENVAVLLDLADRLRREKPLSGWDLARFQRAAKGARQSASGGSDQIVERRVVRLVHLRVDTVVLGHRGVDAEEHRF
jgi:hypothetical protein